MPFHSQIMVITQTQMKFKLNLLNCSLNLYFKKVLHLKKIPLYMFIDHDLNIQYILISEQYIC